MAMLYDLFAVLALWFLVTALVMLAGFHELSVTGDPLYAALLTAVWFGYLAWNWHRGGMTLGMRAWRIRIENTGGGLPDGSRCAVRFLVSIVSAAAFGAGFLWSLFDREKRCWHDIASRTRLLVRRG